MSGVITTSPAGARRRSRLTRSTSRSSNLRSRCHGPLIVTRTSSRRSLTKTLSSGSEYDTPIRAVISRSLSVLTSRNTVTASTSDRNLRPMLSNNAPWTHRRNKPRSGGGGSLGGGSGAVAGARDVRAGDRPSDPSVSLRSRGGTIHSPFGLGLRQTSFSSHFDRRVGAGVGADARDRLADLGSCGGFLGHHLGAPTREQADQGAAQHLSLIHISE